MKLKISLVVLKKDALSRSKINSIEVLVLINSKCLVQVIVIASCPLIIKIKLFKNDLLKKNFVIILQLCYGFSKRHKFVVRFQCPIMYLVLTDVDFQNDVVSWNEFIVLPVAVLLIDIIKDVLLELIIRNEHKFLILVSNFAPLIVQEMLVDVLAHLFLLVLDIRGNDFLPRWLHWIYEIYLAVLFSKKEDLIELLLAALQCNFHILWHYHMLSMSNKREGTLACHLVAQFGIVQLVIAILALN